MRTVFMYGLFLVSLNTFASDSIICSTRCAQVGADDIYNTQIISAERPTSKEAWAKLKLDCQRIYKGYPTELLYLESMRSQRSYNSSNRFWYQDDGMNTWISFKRDKPNSDNCILQQD